MSMQQGLGTNLTVPPHDPDDGADVDLRTMSRASRQLPLTECSGTTRPTGYPRRRVPYCAGLPKEAT